MDQKYVFNEKPGNTYKELSSNPDSSFTIAGADIGSNAVRFMIVRAHFKNNIWEYRREQAIRLPVRLGSDVFSDSIKNNNAYPLSITSNATPGNQKASIQPETIAQLKSAMRLFMELLMIYQPVLYRAYATSALREAANGKSIVSHIAKDPGVVLECIDGHIEATLIYRYLLESKRLPDSPYFLHADVGGGSTELVVGNKKEIFHVATFKDGAVRRLIGKDENEIAREHKWIHNSTKQLDSFALTASGGNARALFTLAGNKKGYISYRALSSYRNKLASLSPSERVEKYGLKANRADTIVPAADIFLDLMRASNTRNLYILNVSLMRGILLSAAKEVQKTAGLPEGKIAFL